MSLFGSIMGENTDFTLKSRLKLKSFELCGALGANHFVQRGLFVPVDGKAPRQYVSGVCVQRQKGLLKYEKAVTRGDNLERLNPMFLRLGSKVFVRRGQAQPHDPVYQP